jgi:hypothetical protein
MYAPTFKVEKGELVDIVVEVANTGDSEVVIFGHVGLEATAPRHGELGPEGSAFLVAGRWEGATDAFVYGATGFDGAIHCSARCELSQAPTGRRSSTGKINLVQGRTPCGCI